MQKERPTKAPIVTKNMTAENKDAFQATECSGFDSNGDVEVNGRVGYTAELDKHAEQKLLRRLDWHLVPPVMLLYMMSFLDRYVTMTFAAPTFAKLQIFHS